LTDVEQNKDRVPKLLNYLAKEGHHTPFEKSTLHFKITTDIATHIQVLKHRIGVSVNAESARYKEIKEDRFYLPNDFPEQWIKKLEEHTKQGLELYHQSLTELTPILGRKRAKESCRFFRGYNTQISADITFNFRSFYHFYKLRGDKEAQKEIKELSEKMLELIKQIPGNPFEYTLKSLEL
jgi:flavin-dependent thymidylate synthase